MSLIDLLILVVVVAGLVWLLLKITFLQPYKEFVVGIGVLIIVVAMLKALFGIDLLAHMRSLAGH